MSENTFQVGDRVRTIVPALPFGKDRIGTVVGPTNHYLGWDVVMDDAPRTPTDYAGWYYHTDELELISDPRDRALDDISDIVKCAFGRRYDAIQAIEVQIPNILRETGRL